MSEPGYLRRMQDTESLIAKYKKQWHDLINDNTKKEQENISKKYTPCFNDKGDLLDPITFGKYASFREIQLICRKIIPVLSGGDSFLFRIFNQNYHLFRNKEFHQFFKEFISANIDDTSYDYILGWIVENAEFDDLPFLEQLKDYGAFSDHKHLQTATAKMLNILNKPKPMSETKERNVMKEQTQADDSEPSNFQKALIRSGTEVLFDQMLPLISKQYPAYKDLFANTVMRGILYIFFQNALSQTRSIFKIENQIFNDLIQQTKTQGISKLIVGGIDFGGELLKNFYSQIQAFMPAVSIDMFKTTPQQEKAQ